jgi:raffinose/stachyose/melibiose transport system permease protein
MDETTPFSTSPIAGTKRSLVGSITGSSRVDRILVSTASHVVLAIFTLIIVYPVLWMVLASFKSQTEIVTNIWGLPAALQWENYVGAWQNAEMGYAVLNSVLTSAGSVVLVVVLASLAGFAFAKFHFRFSLAIFLLFVFTMQAPVPIIPLYVMMVKLGLTDSRIGLILAMAAGSIPLSIFIFQAFFQSIPTDLLDAAKVDGCTELSAFWRVVVPISGPAIATVSILEFVGAWNQYFLPLILIRSPEMRTIPLAIQVFFYEWGRTEWQQVFAALTIGSMPMILLYVLMQRQFIQGLTAGSIKG